jgi:MscS family membrane protein
LFLLLENSIQSTTFSKASMKKTFNIFKLIIKEDTMPKSRRKMIMFVIVLAFALGLIFSGAGWGQLIKAPKETTVKSDAGRPGTEAPKAFEEKTDQLETLERTGGKISSGIDRFGKSAESHFGAWINTSAFAGITWLKLLFCFLLLLLVAVIDRLLQAIIRRHKRDPSVEEEKITVSQFVFEAFSKPLSLFIWVYGIYAALTPLLVHFQQPGGSNFMLRAFQKAADVGAAVALIWFILRLVTIIDVQLKKWAASTDSTIDDVLVPLVGKTLRVCILIIGSVVVIQNLTGVKIGPLLASLGIGGLAIAFAARESIANFFGTLTILFDKPFQVGQRIVINDYDGIVDSVGLRSTRIRTLTGHLLTIPNEKVISSTVENIGLRPHIRWLTNIGITYDTPVEKVEKAVEIIREILADHEGSNEEYPPRVFFNGFNDYSLNIMVIAWYHPPTYWDFQAWLQSVCVEIMNRFEAEGIDFAFPSQTVYLANDDKRQLKIQLPDALATQVADGIGG